MKPTEIEVHTHTPAINLLPGLAKPLSGLCREGQRPRNAMGPSSRDWLVSPTFPCLRNSIASLSKQWQLSLSSVPSSCRKLHSLL